MFGGELVGVVDAVVAAVTQGGFIGGAEQRSMVFATHVALDLHSLSFFCSVASDEISAVLVNEMSNRIGEGEIKYPLTQITKVSNARQGVISRSIKYSLVLYVIDARLREKQILC